MFSDWNAQTSMGTSPALVKNTRFTHEVRVQEGCEACLLFVSCYLKGMSQYPSTLGLEQDKKRRIQTMITASAAARKQVHWWLLH